MTPADFKKWLFDERQNANDKRAESGTSNQVNYWFIREQVLGEIILKIEEMED